MTLAILKSVRERKNGFFLLCCAGLIVLIFSSFSERASSKDKEIVAGEENVAAKEQDTQVQEYGNSDLVFENQGEDREEGKEELEENSKPESEVKHETNQEKKKAETKDSKKKKKKSKHKKSDNNEEENKNPGTEQVLEKISLSINTGNHEYDYFIERGEVKNVFDLMKKASAENGFSLHYENYSFGAFIYEIHGTGSKDDFSRFWMLKVNGKESNFGASDCPVSDGDKIEWEYVSASAF